MSKTESVAVQMADLLDEINEEVRESAKAGIRDVSKEAVQKLRNTSPKKTGSYARGWSSKKVSDTEIIVYNKTEGWKTHILENGHVVKNKKGEFGRVNGIKHIAPVEEWAESELPIRILRGIK